MIMNEIDYIEEIDYWLFNLKDEIRYFKFDVSESGIINNKRLINNRCNNLILYTRALKDKLENG